LSVSMLQRINLLVVVTAERAIVENDFVDGLHLNE